MELPKGTSTVPTRNRTRGQIRSDREHEFVAFDEGSVVHWLVPQFLPSADELRRTDRDEGSFAVCGRYTFLRNIPYCHVLVGSLSTLLGGELRTGHVNDIPIMIDSVDKIPLKARPFDQLAFAHRCAHKAAEWKRVTYYSVTYTR